VVDPDIRKRLGRSCQIWKLFEFFRDELNLILKHSYASNRGQSQLNSNFWCKNLRFQSSSERSKLGNHWIRIRNRNLNCAVFDNKQENQISPALLRLGSVDRL